MSGRGQVETRQRGRVYTREFKEDAVRMLFDGHSAASVCERLGLSQAIARWRRTASNSAIVQFLRG